MGDRSLSFDHPKLEDSRSPKAPLAYMYHILERLIGEQLLAVPDRSGIYKRRTYHVQSVQ